MYIISASVRRHHFLLSIENYISNNGYSWSAIVAVPDYVDSCRTYAQPNLRPCTDTPKHMHASKHTPTHARTNEARNVYTKIIITAMWWFMRTRIVVQTWIVSLSCQLSRRYIYWSSVFITPEVILCAIRKKEAKTTKDNMVEEVMAELEEMGLSSG